MDSEWQLQRTEEEKLKKSKAKKRKAKRKYDTVKEAQVSESNYLEDSESEQKIVQPLFSTQADTMNFLSTRILLQKTNM